MRRSVTGDHGGAGRRGGRMTGRREALVALCLVCCLTGLAAAAPPRGKPRVLLGPATPSWILVQAATGDELDSREPDRPGPPASMTKMMLALLVCEAVRDGQLALNGPLRTSRLASQMGGSQVYLKEGETFTVEELLSALLIGSANDAAVVLAEGLTGSVAGTIQRMNERAGALRLTATRFGSVHGLPPGPEAAGDVTTPRDMARLARELIKFPDILRWTGTKEAPFRGGAFTLRNSNHLIGQLAGVDGIKTGHFAEAGYNLTATAQRGNLRLVAVVMGAASNAARFAEASRLLGEGFARFVEVTVAKAEAPMGGEIRPPRARFPFRPMVARDIRLVVKREERERVRTSVELLPDVRAPLKRG
ncbi:MAG: D-alanyl-D-alanine carboxypeptidase family protein, partial [Candidatus Methylomirabilota bacterium]